MYLLQAIHPLTPGSLQGRADGRELVHDQDPGGREAHQLRRAIVALALLLADPQRALRYRPAKRGRAKRHHVQVFGSGENRQITSGENNQFWVGRKSPQ